MSAGQKPAPSGRPAKAAGSRPRRLCPARFNSGGVEKLAGLGAALSVQTRTWTLTPVQTLPGWEAPPSAPDLFMLLGLCRNTAEP